jgi:hypothetical protein
MDNHFSDIRDVVLFTNDARFRASINNSLMSIGLNDVKIFDMEDSYAKISETLSGCLLLIDIDGLDENLLQSLMNHLPRTEQQVFEPILLYSKPEFSQVDLVSKKMLLEKNKNEDLILRLIQYHLLAAAFFPRREALEEGRDSKGQDLVLFKSGQNYRRIELAEIDYFQAQGKYIIACVGDKKYVASSQLKILEYRYKATFERSHRSYLVNLHKVTGIDKVEGTIELGNKMVLLSDRYKKKFMDRFVIFQ